MLPIVCHHESSGRLEGAGHDGMSSGSWATRATVYAPSTISATSANAPMNAAICGFLSSCIGTIASGTSQAQAIAQRMLGLPR
jgi:hypothetical protein